MEKIEVTNVLSDFQSKVYMTIYQMNKKYLYLEVKIYLVVISFIMEKQ